MGNDIDFLPTAKQEGFLQIDKITLSMRSLSLPKYPQ